MRSGLGGPLGFNEAGLQMRAAERIRMACGICPTAGFRSIKMRSAEFVGASF